MAVKQECVVNHSFFVFYDLPDLIVKKKYSRKDYEDIIKVVSKVKTRYIAEKSKMFPDKALAVISNLTDDDEAPLELFDYVLSEIKNKSDEKKQTISTFLSEMNTQIIKVI